MDALEFLHRIKNDMAARGFCWSLGSTRLAEHEFRIWPRQQKFSKPVIIASGEGFVEAMESGLRKLGDAVPEE